MAQIVRQKKTRRKQKNKQKRVDRHFDTHRWTKLQANSVRKILFGSKPKPWSITSDWNANKQKQNVSFNKTRTTIRNVQSFSSVWYFQQETKKRRKKKTTTLICNIMCVVHKWAYRRATVSDDFNLVKNSMSGRLIAFGSPANWAKNMIFATWMGSISGKQRSATVRTMAHQR